MKILFRFLSLMMFATIFPLSSCTEDPEDSTGTIIGYVTEAPAGIEPIAGVTVSILPNGHSTTTGSDGTFKYLDMQPGSYSLQFSKNGYNTTTRSVVVVAGKDVRCDVQLSRVNETAEIEINPSSLNFGTSQTDMSVTIKNNGNATASWSIELGNNPWLSVSQLGGSIQSGRTQSITFSVNRDFLSEMRSVVVNLQAFGNSYPITISCAPRNATSYMVVEPTTLNFGTGSTQQAFSIRNLGSSTLSWTASGITSPALSLSATQGTVSAGGNAVVIATIDRSLVSGEMISTFVISDGIREQAMVVNVNNNGGSDPDDPDNPGGGNDDGKYVVSNGLTAYYLFNDNFDDVFGEYDGFGVKGPEFVAGISGQAVKFSKPKESAVEIPYGLVNNPSFSVSFWVKDLNDGLIFYSKCSDNQNRFILSMVNGSLRFICTSYANNYKEDSADFLFSHININDQNWHHIAIVSDHGTTTSSTWTSTLYVDGKRCSTISENAGQELQYPNGFVIGGRASLYYYDLVCSSFTMDDFRFYDSRQLSASEIKEIYNARQ